jgi:hypothetical protein
LANLAKWQSSAGRLSTGSAVNLDSRDTTSGVDNGARMIYFTSNRRLALSEIFTASLSVE